MARLISPRSGRFIRGTVARRETLWFTSPGSLVVLAAANQAVLLQVLNAAALAIRPFTIIRSRGVVGISSDQTGATEDQHAAFGCAVVSQQASAAGVGSIPTPVTDDGSDLWFVYQRLMAKIQFASVSGMDANAGKIYEFDSKAMRKVEDGEDLVVVAENGPAGTGAGVRINWYVRFLIKMH